MLDCRKRPPLERPNRHPLKAFTFLMLLFSLLTGVSEAETTANTAELRQLAQLAEYIGVDYAEAVTEGQVSNENEYHLNLGL